MSMHKVEIRHGPPEATQLPNPWPSPIPPSVKEMAKEMAREMAREIVDKLGKLDKPQPDPQPDSQLDPSLLTSDGKPDKDKIFAAIDARVAKGEQAQTVYSEIAAKCGYKKGPSLGRAFRRWKTGR
jgi:hypothetical protein